MKHTSLLVAGLLVASGLLQVARGLADERQRERERGRGHSIESIMKTVHGKKGLMKTLGPMLDADNVKWDSVKAITGKILPLAQDLGQRKPERGTKESWTELTAAYAGFAKELDEAAAKKNKADARDAFDFLNNSCNKCHGRHREKGARE